MTLLQQKIVDIHRDNAVKQMKRYMYSDPIDSWLALASLGDYLELYINSLEQSNVQDN